MTKFDKKMAIDDFVKELRKDIDEIELLISFLRIDSKKEKEMIDDAIRIFRNKIKKCQAIQTIQDAKEHIKVKKLIKDKGVK